MAEQTSPADELQRLLKDHGELLDEIAGFQTWAAEVAEIGFPHFGEMGFRLQNLRDRLADHFAAEERGGYLSSVLRSAPQFAEEIAELERQHDGFLDALDSLIGRLEQPEPPFPSWQAAVREYDDFLAELLRHERRENALLRSASFRQNEGD